MMKYQVTTKTLHGKDYELQCFFCKLEFKEGYWCSARRQPMHRKCLIHEGQVCSPECRTNHSKNNHWWPFSKATEHMDWKIDFVKVIQGEEKQAGSIR